MGTGTRGARGTSKQRAWGTSTKGIRHTGYQAGIPEDPPHPVTHGLRPQEATPPKVQTVRKVCVGAAVPLRFGVRCAPGAQDMGRGAISSGPLGLGLPPPPRGGGVGRDSAPLGILRASGGSSEPPSSCRTFVSLHFRRFGLLQPHFAIDWFGAIWGTWINFAAIRDPKRAKNTPWRARDSCPTVAC